MRGENLARRGQAARSGSRRDHVSGIETIKMRSDMKTTGSNGRTDRKVIAKAADMAKLEADALRACNLLKAMANPARLMVLCQIADGEKSVNELARAVGLSQSGLSQHLTVLRNRSLVATRRVGQTIYYSLASAEAASVMATLYEVFCRRPTGHRSGQLRMRTA
jgi:ArsR family transcriptional regulator, virulence genes transcriptional regulator